VVVSEVAQGRGSLSCTKVELCEAERRGCGKVDTGLGKEVALFSSNLRYFILIARINLPNVQSVTSPGCKNCA
jgi:hypothetical protein